MRCKGISAYNHEINPASFKHNNMSLNSWFNIDRFLK